MEWLIKVGIVVAMGAIIVSLGSGLFFLINDRSRTDRMLSSLKVRITLSVILFLLIVAGLATGVLHPNATP